MHVRFLSSSSVCINSGLTEVKMLHAFSERFGTRSGHMFWTVNKQIEDFKYDEFGCLE